MFEPADSCHHPMCLPTDRRPETWCVEAAVGKTVGMRLYGEAVVLAICHKAASCYLDITYCGHCNWVPKRSKGAANPVVPSVIVET
jgi:hypothetical protein